MALALLVDFRLPDSADLCVLCMAGINGKTQEEKSIIFLN